MAIIRIDTNTINAAANDCGLTPEQYITRSKTFFLGRRICVSFKRFENDGAISVFSIR